MELFDEGYGGIGIRNECFLVSVVSQRKGPLPVPLAMQGQSQEHSCGWGASPTLWLGSWRRRGSLAPFPGCCRSTTWVPTLPCCSQAGRAWPRCTAGSPGAPVNSWSWNPTSHIDLDGSGRSPPCVISAKFPIFMWGRSYYLFSIWSCRPPAWQVCPLLLQLQFCSVFKHYFSNLPCGKSICIFLLFI